MLKRILLAATVGAVMGTLVALELTPMFWWVGTIVGFLVGYMAYDPATVASATKTAYLQAISWRPKEGWQRRSKIRVYVSLCTGSIIAWAMELLTVAMWLMVTEETKQESTEQIFSILLLAVVFGIAGSFLGLPISNSLLERDYCSVDEVRKFALRWNPISTPFIALYYIIKYGGKTLFLVGAGLVVAIISTPNAVRATGRGLRTFFVTLVHLIHSHARMVAGMSGATGTVVGYFTGSATLGGIAGFLTGLAAWGVTSFLVKHLPAPVRVS